MSRLRTFVKRAVSGPDYPPDAGDLAEVRLFGLALPVRASIAVLATTALLLLDNQRALLPGELGSAAPLGITATSLERLVLFLVVPVGIVLALGDRPQRSALRLGDWRWGGGLLIAGLVVMTPIILWLATLPSFRAYYGSSPSPFFGVLGSNLTELIPAEFLFRGFLMFALWRRIGPLALVVAQVPFILVHVGKPDVELWSTFVGGAVFAWLDWRTGSILWSALGHAYVLTLMVVAVGGAAA